MPEKHGAAKQPVTGKASNKIQEVSIDDVLGETTDSKSLTQNKVLPNKDNIQEETVDKTHKSGTSFAMQDFGDGKGAVSAHRHKNPDGTEGGWVQDTAIVDKDVYIGKDAQVSGNAQVLKHSRIMHNAKVSGNAVVSETGLYNNSQVYGNAVLTKSTLRGNAKVYDGANVANSIICGKAKIREKMEVINKTIVGGLFGNKELSQEKRGEINLNLFEAIREGIINSDIKTVENLLQLGADINVRDENNVMASELLPALTASIKTEIWKAPTGDRVYSSPCIGKDGTIYVGSDDGKLYAIDTHKDSDITQSMKLSV